MLVAHIKRVIRGVVLTSASLAIVCGMLSSVAYAASPVTYSLSPASGSVQPNALAGMTLKVTTTIALAGGSVHIDFSNGSYDSFQSAASSNLSFVDYHPEQGDVLYICNNNNCPPGTYTIATINAKAAAAGVMKAVFTPKETINPQLAAVGADGTTGSYTISSNAPTPTSPPAKSSNGSSVSTFTIPADDSSGGTTPLQVTADQLAQSNLKAQEQIVKGTAAGGLVKWSPKKLISLGVGIGVGTVLIALTVIKLIKRSGGGGGPLGPSDPNIITGNF